MQQIPRSRIRHDGVDGQLTAHYVRLHTRDRGGQRSAAAGQGVPMAPRIASERQFVAVYGVGDSVTQLAGGGRARPAGRYNADRATDARRQAWMQSRIRVSAVNTRSCRSGAKLRSERIAARWSSEPRPNHPAAARADAGGSRPVRGGPCRAHVESQQQRIALRASAEGFSARARRCPPSLTGSAMRRRPTIPFSSRGRPVWAKNWSLARCTGSGTRRGGSFCAVNCAALSDELFEAELFGHARGRVYRSDPRTNRPDRIGPSRDVVS